MREGVTTVQPIKISYFPPIVDSLVFGHHPFAESICKICRVLHKREEGEG